MCDATFKQFVCIRCVIQQSDRSDCAESACVEHEKSVMRYSNHDVVRELVLSNNALQFCRRLPGERPIHYLFESAEGFYFAENIDVHSNSSAEL